MSENIIHLVLARTQNAPEGSKGMSLFIVPKYLEKEGHYSKRNDVTCVSLEHKLGIHASPTCSMSFGDSEGAVGYLVGAENHGLKYMFTMMNNARLCVGLQGIAIADRALQHATLFAQERVQGKSLDTSQPAPIIEHPDVYRMLMTMHSLVLAGRTLTYEAALYIDQDQQDYIDLLTPIVKSWCTDMAQEVTSLAIQVHGGMGFIEETGVAQYARDARILPIYEGTNGIQALDLVFRKILKTKGDLLFSYLEGRVKVNEKHTQLLKSIEDIKKVTLDLLEQSPSEMAMLATPYLNGLGYILGGIAMARREQALLNVTDKGFITRQRACITFYMRHILPRAQTELLVCVG